MYIKCVRPAGERIGKLLQYIDLSYFFKRCILRSPFLFLAKLINIKGAKIQVNGNENSSPSRVIMESYAWCSCCLPTLYDCSNLGGISWNLSSLTICHSLTSKVTFLIFDWLWSTVTDCCHGNSQWMTNCQWWQVSWNAPPPPGLTHSERRPQKYLFLRGNRPLLYHQIGNRNFVIFITNQ